MSLSGGPPPKSIDASRLTIPDGGDSTSIPASCCPFKVSFMASKERNMIASSGDGGGGAGGPCDDVPIPQFPRFLTILYNLICINQSCQSEFKDISHLHNLN